MARRPGRGLYRLAGRGERRDPAAPWPRAGDRQPAVERAAIRLPARPGDRRAAGLPGRDLCAVLQPVPRLRRVVVACLPAGLLAALGLASRRLDPGGRPRLPSAPPAIHASLAARANYIVASSARIA